MTITVKAPEKTEVEPTKIDYESFGWSKVKARRSTGRRRIVELYPRWRPMVNGNFVADIVWRYSPPEITTRMIRQQTDILENVARRLNGRGYSVEADDLKIRWNRHLGCSMCPCSPGWEISLKKGYAPLVKKQWLELVDKGGDHASVWVPEPPNTIPHGWLTKYDYKWEVLNMEIGWVAEIDKEVNQ